MASAENFRHGKGQLVVPIFGKVHGGTYQVLKNLLRRTATTNLSKKAHWMDSLLGLKGETRGGDPRSALGCAAVVFLGILNPGLLNAESPWKVPTC